MVPASFRSVGHHRTAQAVAKCTSIEGTALHPQPGSGRSREAVDGVTLCAAPFCQRLVLDGLPVLRIPPSSTSKSPLWTRYEALLARAPGALVQSEQDLLVLRRKRCKLLSFPASPLSTSLPASPTSDPGRSRAQGCSILAAPPVFCDAVYGLPNAVYRGRIRMGTGRCPKTGAV